MTRLTFYALVLGFVFSLAPNVFASDNPTMDTALDLLRAALATNKAPAQADSKQTAPATNKPGVATAPSNQSEVLALLREAKESLWKAPRVYKGRREKAIEYVDAAIKALNEGDPQKSSSYIRKAITEVKQAVTDVKHRP